MRIRVYLCRGNFKSAWAAENGYEQVAEVLFDKLEVGAYSREYDDARSGSFAPLRFVPKDKTVVLGLISTKVGELEPKNDLKHRIDKAAKHVPLDELCLSPQCGFSSTVHGATRSQLRISARNCSCLSMWKMMFGVAVEIATNLRRNNTRTPRSDSE